MNKTFLFLTSLLFIYSCNNSTTSPPLKKEKEVKSKPSKQVQSKVEKPKRELITNRNVKEKLTEYGKENTESVVLIKTDKGDIKVRLYKDTPLHRANFILMAKNGCFDNSVFTRVVKDFMAQAGGTYDEEMVAKRNSIGKYTVPAEIKRQHIHKFGAFGAARSYNDNPDKRSSPYNFYFVEGSTYNDLTLDKYEELNNYTYSPEQREFYKNNKGAAHIDGEHTVFGEVIEGFDVIPKLTSVKKSSRDWPTTDIFISEVIVLE